MWSSKKLLEFNFSNLLPDNIEILGKKKSSVSLNKFLIKYYSFNFLYLNLAGNDAGFLNFLLSS
jgi:hypothetical protein